MVHPRYEHRAPSPIRDNFFIGLFFKLFLPPYHKKKKLKTVLTYFLKFFLFISFSPWVQPSLSNL